MQCDGFHEEIYGFHALGSLSGQELEEIGGHLDAGCVTCHRELARAVSTWTAVASAAPSVRPPRALRRRVLASVGVRSRWETWTWPGAVLLGSAALLFAVGAVWLPGWPLNPHVGVPSIVYSPTYTVTVQGPRVELPVPSAIPIERSVTPPNPDSSELAALRQRLAAETMLRQQAEAELNRQMPLLAASQHEVQNARHEVQNAQQEAKDAQRKYAVVAGDLKAEAEWAQRTEELEKQVATYRALLAIQRKRIDQDLQLASMVRDPQLRLVNLLGTEKGQTATGRAILAGGSRLLFLANDLPPLPAGRAYQLWLIRSNGQAIASAGVFSPDPSRRAMVQFANAAFLTDVTAFSVTDEPAGGSAQPTGHKWLIGS